MKKVAISVLAMFALLATAAFAADVSGKWSGEVEGRNGQKRMQTFNLKADGDKLTGSMLGREGNEIPIEDGKIAGDEISFTVTVEMGGNSRKMEYKGKVTGDSINFKTGQGERAREFTAKRATS